MVHQQIISIAEDVCNSSDVRYRMSAVIFKGKEVFAFGHNRHYTMSGRERLIYGIPYCSIHAEVDAVLDFVDYCGKQGYTPQNVSIYVHRQRGRLAKPCAKCMSLLKHVGIDKIYWSGQA